MFTGWLKYELNKVSHLLYEMESSRDNAQFPLKVLEQQSLLFLQQIEDLKAWI